MSTRLRERPTPELILIMLSVTATVVIILYVATMLVLAIARPDVDLGGLTRNVLDLVNVLIGALVGYVAGRTTAPHSESVSSEDDAT